MPVYNFKKMSPIPSAPDMVDIVLTRTQRRTPTVIHPGYKITRIRSFYMRKIRFTQQTIHERLSQILTDFPRLDDIHPFYADLCNTLYDRDHYKLALGQISAARSVIDSISRDMVRMVKYGDSLYRCKCLKRAALGRMCTVLKGQKSAFTYLEEVRKHLSRLPALDPTARTLLLCGFPNVGKSSFMNKITRAEVDVQPYAFTTKSLFVGHCDYRYLRWQIIDTPGILDHPLEDRNTIEMQSITALAHLTCSVLYFMDASESCGYSIKEQCTLFESICPLFANKEVIIVVNKVDQMPFEDLDVEKQQLIKNLNHEYMCMSNLSELGVSDVKNKACDKLLQARVDARLSSSTSKKINNVMSRLQVFYPAKRDENKREPFIPKSVQTSKPKRSNVGYSISKKTLKDTDEPMDASVKTARDFMWENGGPGVWAPDYRDIYDLKEEEWRYDAIPQILNGKNICDYVDPDIQVKLEALEKEEEQIVAELDAVIDPEESDLEEEEEAVVTAIHDKQKIARIMHHVNQSQNKPIVPRKIRGRAKDKHDPGELDTTRIKKKMDSLGVDSSLLEQRGRKRVRAISRVTDDDMSVEGESPTKRSRSRSHSRPKKLEEMGLKDKDALLKVKKKTKKGQKKWEGFGGEGDRRQYVHLVQWCNTGKKRMGTHYQR